MTQFKEPFHLDIVILFYVTLGTQGGYIPKCQNFFKK